MRHTYPADVVTEDQKRAWRRNARKQARAEGTYTPEPRTVTLTQISSPREGNVQRVPGELVCTSCGFRFLYGNVPHYHEGKPYHKTCHPDFPVPQNFLNDNFTPQTLPDSLMELGFSQGLKIEQMLLMLRGWKKPFCVECKKYMVPWQSLVVKDDRLHHAECIPDGEPYIFIMEEQSND